jgi:hypothetical protein
MKLFRYSERVTGAQRILRTVESCRSTLGGSEMDLVAIQMGLTVVLLIAHVLRVVRDRMSRSRDA